MNPLRLAQFERKVADLERRIAGGVGTNRLWGGQTETRATQVGFPAVLTSAYNEATGYSWSQLVLDTTVPQIDNPAVPRTGDMAFTPANDQSLQVGQTGWLEVDPQAGGWIFLPEIDSEDCDSTDSSTVPSIQVCLFPPITAGNAIFLQGGNVKPVVTANGKLGLCVSKAPQVQLAVCNNGCGSGGGCSVCDGVLPTDLCVTDQSGRFPPFLLTGNFNSPGNPVWVGWSSCITWDSPLGPMLVMFGPVIVFCEGSVLQFTLGEVFFGTCPGGTWCRNLASGLWPVTPTVTSCSPFEATASFPEPDIQCVDDNGWHCVNTVPADACSLLDAFIGATNWTIKDANDASCNNYNSDPSAGVFPSLCCGSGAGSGSGSGGGSCETDETCEGECLPTALYADVALTSGPCTITGGCTTPSSSIEINWNSGGGTTVWSSGSLATDCVSGLVFSDLSVEIADCEVGAASIKVTCPSGDSYTIALTATSTSFNPTNITLTGTLATEANCCDGQTISVTVTESA